MTNVVAQFSDGLLSLTLSRPDKKNALTRQMYQSLADNINLANEDESIKVVLIKGEGDSFTAGNDIGDFAAQGEGESVAETGAFMTALLNCKKVVVAQVQGMAVGIGTTLLLHCDLVYCTPNAKFVLPFINLGLVPEYASSYLLPKLVGHRKASEWLMLGEPFSSDEALQFGIVNKVITPDLIDHFVNDVCGKLIAKPSFALSHTKSLLINEASEIKQQMNEEMDIFIEALSTAAAKEAFDAFLNKRPINPDIFK